MRDLIADGASQDAIDALLPFLASQMGPAAEPRTLRRFKAFRDEALLHASGLARLPARRRKGIDDPDRLDREEMRLTGAVTELISDIDDALRSAKAAVPAAPPPWRMILPVRSLKRSSGAEICKGWPGCCKVQRRARLSAGS
uniref:Uncharacterized protein n=1 Tax=Yoonia rhodophyticola TaxID=3137370 RepID=A0AAN0NJX2_9RHOB